MVKIREGNKWRALWCRHDWEYMFFEQPGPKSFRYIRQCRKCGMREMFATKDMEDIPWE